MMIRKQGMNNMEQHRIVPFYQTYNMPPYQAPYMPAYAMHGFMPLYMAQDMGVKEDLQYLQEMFPEMAKRYAVKIATVVDRMDYKGSMIYDEYPDRLRLQRLAHDIVQMIEKEEAAAASDMQQDGMGTENMSNTDMRTDMQRGGADMRDAGNRNRTSSSDFRYREELVYVLLLYEIAKRRHGAGMDLSKFYGVGDI